MKTKLLSAISIISALTLELSAQSLGTPSRTDLSVSAVTMGMGDNYVAVPDGVPSLFANPAGLVLSDKKRELQFSLGGFRPMNLTSTDGEPLDMTSAQRLTRIHVGNAGFAVASSNRCKSKGAGFGIAYQSPYSLDALVDYTGSYVSGQDKIDYTNKYLSTGNLDLWTVGFSFLAAQGFSVGASVSAVTGHGTEDLWYEKHTNGIIKDTLNDSYHFLSERQYSGYDARLGLMLQGPEAFTFGARIELPGVVAFREYGTYDATVSRLTSAQKYVLDGYLKSYFAGATGVSIKLPGLLLTSELSARAPYPRVRLSDPQRYWKLGAGVGGEITLPGDLLQIRGGYSWHDYNLNPYTVTYIDPVIVDNAPEPQSLNGEHALSIGGTYHFNDHVALEAAYSHRLWKTNTGSLAELNQSQQGMVSLTFGR